MVNKIIEKVIIKLMAKKFGIRTGLKIEKLEVTPGKDGYSTVDISCRFVVNDSDVLSFVDKLA